MKFHSIIELSGKSATGFSVPEEMVTALGTSKKPAVTITINSYSYRSTVAVMGGRYMIPLSAEHRKGAGVAAGDEVEIDIQLDTEPREIVVPVDLASALEAEAAAGTFFASLSYSNKRRLVLAIEDAKTAETRQRRIEKTVAMLKDGRAQ
ncbi:YdeI/OmpD-associated family protein [Paenibacillus sinopodophylli]|uniref:YdeI/OmpD-associated family protein n=1 Tax=Paenibacillus sinopodophylli TaxID=1837342 RepID=UPI00110CA8BF|nr:YdeI/OmpD-associated family protein [Paenibacillus sinopodophylli]